MRKHVLIVLALGALIAVSAVGMATAAGGGEPPVTVKVGNLELTAGGGFSPKALSKTKQTPIEFFAEGEVKNADGTHPPAVREVIVEADKAGEVHTKGIPTCKSGQLQATETAAAKKACGTALIGEGEATAQVAFAEQKPINVTTHILVFNGGESGGKTTLYIHAYFSNPISGAIVTTVTIKKHPHGRFGTLAVAKIPQITGGSGSIIKFNLKIFKTVKVKGKTYNPISSKCEDGKLKVHVEGKFEDGTKASTEIVRACTPKG
ncbi:MAG TPA: hypothetical protein VHZ54_12850 [Solirubrobacterales bacterium]|jgi:hypothetical protein|nr:hypothetical protein [Solirubrobacterales bacterium]